MLKQTTSKLLTKKYFDTFSLTESNIKSFNYLIEHELTKILQENAELEPQVLPPEIESFKIKLEKIWIEKPVIIEADGSRRQIFPMEARLRQLNYSAPVYIQLSTYVNGVQRETLTTQIGNIPIMLKSKFCYLNGLSSEELIGKGEDPDDPGGYFIINGTEKALVMIEDLAPNNFLVDKQSVGVSPYVGKIFSESGTYKIQHVIEQLKDILFYISFTRVKRIPVFIVLKALGMTSDEEIIKAIDVDDLYIDEIYMNLYKFAEIKTQEEALDYIAKRIGITQPSEIRIERIRNMLEKFFLPHIGMEAKDLKLKAYNLCKYIKYFILHSKGAIQKNDKDHLKNKRLKLAGELLADLIRVNLKILLNDAIYNFQRVVKRGKFPSLKVIIREKLLTSRIYSAMATGNWLGNRTGVSQRMERVNYLQTISHLQRVVSPLSSSQENFEARELHPTHYGRLCAIETPEGPSIGLRKNLALFASVSEEAEENKVMDKIKELGVKIIK